ncbi:NAD binding domain of 6-phosphogluconate dehydrogenase-domain-containing protein [Aspergillus pseudoustus]|uniref:NAD binding domain of 6-phosphogluconate dehydrogenase-domain-containing protein n=1 Tax=Aspergillus pseudoustus TaxID=1810923 RepID=A0ABR4IY43_9EURO
MADDIGFIGIGNMGYGMAGNIRTKMPGDATFYINDVVMPTCERFVREFGGFGPIIIGKSPKEIAEKTKTIITMLPAGSHVRRVYLEGNASIFQAPADKDRLLLECSTIGVNTAKEIGRMGLETGKGTYIDAPVSGGVKAAAAGTLSFMVGAVGPREQDTNSMNRRAFNMISMMADPAKIIFAGQLGTGLAAKIANNYIAFCTSLATAEAMSIGVRSGVEPKTLFSIIRASTGNSWHLDIKPCIPDIVSTAPSSNGYAPAFKPFMVVKDLGLALEAARETGIDPRCAKAALEIYKTASELPRYKDLDCTAVWLLINEKEPPSPET